MAIKFNRSQTFATNGTVTATGLHNLVDGLDIYQALITDQTNLTSVGTADELLIADADLTPADSPRAVTVQELFNDALSVGTYTDAYLTGNFTTGTANITIGTIPNLTIGTTTATRGTVTTLNSTTGTITNLTAGTTISTAANITNGTIPTLTSTTLFTTGTGTAASPAIVPTGDTNTGIFFPATDTIAFSEGGTEALRLTSTGAISVGSSGTNYGSSNQVLTSQGNAGPSWVNAYTGFKNRIINGDMRIDQRNAGASVTINTTANVFSLDRWAAYGQSTDGVFTLQRSASTPPTDFSYFLRVTTTTADGSIGATQSYGLRYVIEGNDIADLKFGTASAKEFTLSFWVRSSLTGTFGGSLSNDASNRFYVFSFDISAANTWEYKTITLTGDTSGTWETGTGAGIKLFISLGAGSTLSGTAGSWGSTAYYGLTSGVNVIGTLNATLDITGVQLELGSAATNFERRPIGTELALCQRYYQKMSTNARAMANGYNTTTTVGRYTKPFIVAMRASPTALETTGTAANYRILHAATSTACSVVPAFSGASEYEIEITGTVASGLTAGQGSVLAAAVATDAHLAWGAEL